MRKGAQERKTRTRRRRKWNGTNHQSARPSVTPFGLFVCFVLFHSLTRSRSLSLSLTPLLLSLFLDHVRTKQD